MRSRKLAWAARKRLLLAPPPPPPPPDADDDLTSGDDGLLDAVAATDIFAFVLGAVVLPSFFLPTYIFDGCPGLNECSQPCKCGKEESFGSKCWVGQSRANDGGTKGGKKQEVVATTAAESIGTGKRDGGGRRRA
jgi:hypothetical protein